MSQFATTGKNPPWVRNTGAGIGQATQLLVQAAIGASGVASAQSTAAPVTLQQQQPQQQTVAQQATAYNAGLTALGLAQVGLEQPRENVFLVQNAALQPGTVLSQPGVAIPTSLTTTPVVTPGIALPTTLAATPVATVSYPAPRSLQHPTQFQPQAQQPQQAPQHAPKQRVFTGTVSKLLDNFGFVDDDVFFQITCIKGTMPKVGDRVLVEASYNPSMPFKWNAARIQVLPNQPQVQVQTQQGPSPQQAILRPTLLSANPVASSIASAGLAPQITIALATQPGNGMTSTLTIPALAQATQNYSQVQPSAVIHTMAQSPAAVRSLPSLMGTRRHSPPSARRDRERDARRDERRERERHREHERERERLIVVRKRSRSPRPRSRSPPRRRARVAPRYMVQVPKISLDLKEANVMELRKRYANMYVPSDFFFSSFVWMDAFPLHRPFTLERPCSFHIMSKEVDSIRENDAVLDPPDADHSFSAKVMLMAAPSLEEIHQKSSVLGDDTSEPRDGYVHPTRLVNFLVGLKSKNETMAIGGPWSPSLDGPDPESDPLVLVRTAIRTCKGLTGVDLTACTKWYRFAEVYYRRGESTHKGRAAPARVETVVIFLPDVWSCTPTLKEWDVLTISYKKQLQKRLPEETPDSKANQAMDDSTRDLNKKDPSHHSELEPKTMKLSELRHELEVRNLSSKGLKSQLVARLTKALKAEHEKEEEEAAEVQVEEDDADDDVRADVDEKDEERKKREEEEKRKDEKEKVAREKRYTLPEMPSILVHPSRVAKGGKFDCTVMSLSVLLDYRQEDNKEYSFEVSLFAELFNEMLMRDFGFRIYRAVVDVPEKKDDDKEKKKEKKDDKKDGSKDDCKDVAKKDKRREEEDVDEEEDFDEYDDDLEEDDDEDRRGEKKKDDKKKDKRGDKARLCVADPNLLLACVYFDQNHCGYILDKDLEEIFYTLGLNLSRAQTRKLLQNVVVKDKLMYRRLSDSSKARDGDQDKVMKDVEDKSDKESVVPIQKDKQDRTGPSLEVLAAGNKALLGTTKLESRPKESSSQGKGPPEVNDTGLVIYNGALVDISKLLLQLQRSEEARLDVELKMKEMQEEMSEVKESATSLEQVNQKTTSELREYKRRLRSAEDELRAQQRKSHKYFDVLRECHSLIQPMLVTSNDTPSCPSAVNNTDDCGRTVVEGVDGANENVVIKKEVVENGKL